MDFRDAKSNFYNAARYGSAAQFYWNNQLITYKELLLDELLPMAYKGLYKMKVAPKDVEHYLGIIKNRINGRNGARCMVESLRALKKKHRTPEAVRILTASMYENERRGYTVDAWQLARGDEYVPRKNKKRFAFL